MRHGEACLRHRKTEKRASSGSTTGSAGRSGRASATSGMQSEPRLRRPSRVRRQDRTSHARRRRLEAPAPTASTQGHHPLRSIDPTAASRLAPARDSRAPGPDRDALARSLARRRPVPGGPDHQEPHPTPYRAAPARPLGQRTPQTLQAQYEAAAVGPGRDAPRQTHARGETGPSGDASRHRPDSSLVAAGRLTSTRPLPERAGRDRPGPTPAARAARFSVWP